MASFNKVILLGNLTRDPQLKYLPSQTPVVEFGLASSRKFKGSNGEMREDTCFIECAAFGRTAEIINQYCRKGNPLFVEGRLKYDSWEDKNGGGKRSRITVVAENIQLMGGRDGGQRGGAPGGYSEDHSAPQSAPQGAPRRPQSSEQPPVEQPFAEEPQFSENDIPF